MYKVTILFILIVEIEEYSTDTGSTLSMQVDDANNRNEHAIEKFLPITQQYFFNGLDNIDSSEEDMAVITENNDERFILDQMIHTDTDKNAIRTQDMNQFVRKKRDITKSDILSTTKEENAEFKPLNDDSLGHSTRNDLNPHLTKSDKNKYRRILSGDLKKLSSKYLIHCQDLITPFLTGQKTNMSHVKTIKYSDHVVIRLTQLMSEDPSHMTREEIYSVLFQISKLQIRLFQWEVPAMRLLLNTITKETAKRHTFRTLKRGLKALLSGWHLDYHNVTGLLRQSRLFRPPCVQFGEQGSTLTSRAVRYTKPTTKKRKCSPDTEENSSCEI